MLSILIPTYNHSVTKLVDEILLQGKNVDIPFEIIIFDDHSSIDTFKEKNNLALKNITYRYLPKNVGRSKIRNLLAQEAKYQFLLFLDADVLPKNNTFLADYFNSIDDKTEVMYGGRVHLPNQNTSLLRWKYGFHKEDKSALERNQKPYISIITNNLLLKKNIFEILAFDEELKTYGHEDTLFSYELKKINASVKHIENPVIHQEIDSNKEFLIKTKGALQNLKLLFKQKKLNSDFVKILKIQQWLKTYRLDYILSGFYYIFEPLMRKNLLSKRSSVFIFNIYKLTYFCKINL